MEHTGLFAVITGPAAVGKSTVVRELLTRVPGSARLVTATTRSPREGEQDGVDYHFMSRGDFEKMRENGELFEWAETYGNYYGTPLSELQKQLRLHRVVFAVLDPRGTHVAQSKFPEKTVTIFLVPDSIEQLREWIITERGDSAKDEFNRRYKEADEELRLASHFNHVVMNRKGKLAETVAEIRRIIQQYL